MFSKDLNDVLIGSDTGYVECFNVQKHKPSDRIVFIKLEHGHFLVCQKNHPLFIKREDTLLEIDASELDVCTDEIWVDNDITKNEFNLQLCEDKDLLNLTTKLFVSGNLDEIYNINDEFKDIIFGDSYKNIRLFPNFINCDRTQLTKFIDMFGNICKALKDYCKSYILASQIKMICDRINYDCDVTPYEKHNTTYYKFDIKPNLTEELYFNKYCKINEIYELIYYDDFVYDVKTCNNAYMLNCVKNHNSFHCISKNQLNYVKINDEYKVMSFERIWNFYSDSKIYITEDGKQEEKILDNLYVWDKDKFTKVLRIMRHLRHSESPMVFTRNNNNDFIVCQDNHPIMLSKNISICECETPFNKPKKLGKWICPNCGKSPNNKIVNHTSDEIYLKTEVKNYIKSKYFTFNDFPIWQNEKKSTTIDAYTLGLFLAEGSYLYYYGDKLTGIIISQEPGVILDEANKILSESYKTKINGCKTRSIKQLIIYDEILANNLINQTNRYSFQKSLGCDYIYYSDEDLSKILCGYIDGDGSFIKSLDDNNKSNRNYISLESTSLELIQQLHHILNKFNIRHNIQVCSVKKLTKHQSYCIKIYLTEKHRDIFKHSIKCKNKKYEKDFDRNRYENLLTYQKLIKFDDSEFVYDFMTESETFTTNGIWSHNSGGSASIKKVDIIKELKRNISSHDESRIENIFYQKDSDLYLKNDSCIITIDKNVFLNAESKIELTQNEIKLEVGYFTINVDNFIIEATIEQDAILAIHDRQNFVENENTIAINYFKNEKLFGIKSKIIEPEDVATMLDAFAGGKSPFKTPENLYTKLYNFLAPMKSWDSVHLEVIIGNLLRNKKDPQYPARIKEPYEYTTLSVKTLPMVQSWSLGLAFEDIGKAISYGLISDRQPASSIEKVLFGEPLSDIAIKKLKEKK